MKDGYKLDIPPKIPRFHDLIAAGVEEEQAMAWHDAIMLMEQHACNMAERIEEVVYAMPLRGCTLQQSREYFLKFLDIFS